MQLIYAIPARMKLQPRLVHVQTAMTSKPAPIKKVRVLTGDVNLLAGV